MSIITLLTDFGTQDEYAGVVKGVILGINPGATLVDISHHVPPQGVQHAGDMLKTAFGWFPRGTIHLAVVDPGVGSRRAILAARYAGHLFVAPDNGLLSFIWGDLPPEAVVRVENSRLFLQPVSATFQGRDILAPVAAHLSLGMALTEIGSAVDFSQVVRLARHRPRETDDGEIIGEVMSADRFGNLRTNIDATHLDRLRGGDSRRVMVVRIGAHQIEGMSSHYAQGEKGGLMALVGSRNQLEIAVSGGSALRLFPDCHGLEVRVRMDPKTSQ
jgi:hypothetical protein